MKDYRPAVPLFDALRPGYCQRWGVHPEMAGTEAHAAHAARVARILLWAWPEASASALVWAILHDDGEMGFGDMSGPAKRNDPVLRDALERGEARQREALGIFLPDLPPDVATLFDLCDKLAALYHMKQVRPQELRSARGRADLRDMAERFLSLPVFTVPFLRLRDDFFEAFDLNLPTRAEVF